MNGRGGI
jgi:hypothetical protein